MFANPLGWFGGSLNAWRDSLQALQVGHLSPKLRIVPQKVPFLETIRGRVIANGHNPQASTPLAWQGVGGRASSCVHSRIQWSSFVKQTLASSFQESQKVSHLWNTNLFLQAFWHHREITDVHAPNVLP